MAWRAKAAPGFGVRSAGFGCFWWRAHPAGQGAVAGVSGRRGIRGCPKSGSAEVVLTRRCWRKGVAARVVPGERTPQPLTHAPVPPHPEFLLPMNDLAQGRRFRTAVRFHGDDGRLYMPETTLRRSMKSRIYPGHQCACAVMTTRAPPQLSSWRHWSGLHLQSAVDQLPWGRGLLTPVVVHASPENHVPPIDSLSAFSERRPASRRTHERIHEQHARWGLCRSAQHDDCSASRRCGAPGVSRSSSTAIGGHPDRFEVRLADPFDSRGKPCPRRQAGSTRWSRVAARETPTGPQITKRGVAPRSRRLVRPPCRAEKEI